MKINPPPPREYGPRPRGPEPPLSTTRAAVFQQLRDQQPDPMTLARLMTATGLHANTLRDHLAALVRRGLVRRQRAEPLGRGRPAWLYELTGTPPTGSEYAGLAAALAAAITRTNDDPGPAAAAAGEEWGRALARDRGATSLAPDAAREQVIRLLDDMGFEPETPPAPHHGEDDEVRLTACPLLEAADRYPEVVCAVHLGIVRGALTEYGADPAGSGLVPFAEPGACRLTLAPRSEANS